MISYLIEVTLCWTVFYGIYHLLLGRETFFQLNRWYLLGTTLFGLIIPVIEIAPMSAEAPTYYLQPITIGVEELEAVIVTASAADAGFDFWQLLVWVYWVGVAVSLARFGYGLLQVSRLYRAGEKTAANGYCFVATPAPHIPFSFFKNLFWSKKFEVGEDDRRSIVRHEEAHIFQWHSLDVLLLELAAIACWCSPLVYLYKKAVKTTHEYLADAYVTEGFNKKQYGRLLLRQSHPGMQIAISNSLFSSQLKKRIAMMTKTKSSQRASLKYLVALPAAAMLLLAFSLGEKRTDSFLLADNQLFTTEYNPVLTDTVPTGDDVFKTVEEMPRFPGCENLAKVGEQEQCAQTKLVEFISSNLKYPKMAKEKAIEGMVVVKFVVQKDGSLADVDIIKGIGGGCEEEVLRIVDLMPSWVPGKKDQKPVAVEFKLPIRFKLDATETAPGSTKINEVDEKPQMRSAIRYSSAMKIDEVDEMPVMAGCENLTGDERKKCSDGKLVQAVFGNVKYPKEAREKGVEGMVVVKFVIQIDGSVTNPEIVRSVGSGCDEEVLRVVGEMPNWVPGTKVGQPVPVEISLPVKFKLDAADAAKLPKAEVFEAFPNPASSDGFSVRFKAGAGKVSIVFRDAAGREVMEKTLQNYDGTEQTLKFGTKGLFENGTGKGTVFVSLYNEKGSVLGSTTVIIQ